MGESAIRDYARSRGFHRQTLERWLRWAEADRDSLQPIAAGLRASENHLRDIMDWLEEIALRDGAKIHEILASPVIEALRTDPRLGRADRLKRIKDQLRRRRLPRLAALEDELAAIIKALQLPGGVRVSAPPGLEGGRLKVELDAGSAAEMQELSGRLSVAAASDAMAQIFALLAGRRGESGRDEAEIRVENDLPPMAQSVLKNAE
jgi:hypothetical protein